MNSDNHAEPEDLVGKSKYLLELIQMDLNFGRTETILARAIAARKYLEGLVSLYTPAQKEVKASDVENYLIEENWRVESPDEVGLFMCTSEHLEWVYRYVAITEQTGELFVHDENLPKARRLRLYAREMGQLFWKRAA